MGMKGLLGVIAAAFLTAQPLLAQQMHQITDHSGQQVELPVDPQRIVSLHDWTATVMVHELGGNLIGSSGRLDRDGKYYIRSGRELYGLEFGDVQMASAHGKVDLERIAMLEPDLIIGNSGDTLAYRDQLAQIAPTVMFDPMNGQPPMQNYRDLAGWIGRSAAFEAKKAEYDARIVALRKSLIGDGPAPSYVAMSPNPENGRLRIFRTYGAQTTVLDDLGFRRAEITDQVPETSQEAAFSAEMIGLLDADYIFTTHFDARGETPETVMEQMDQVAPGYRNVIPAVRAGRFVSMRRFQVYPTTFAAMDVVMKQLETMPR
ncbi:ABC transporter substrate-binding protein [Paracoccus laeviglucosivorans]|uniref:Iron complex transport system substrate-binding protein n=1 Tax=Paracoccus laeviglucosivorans TaxID=1197861 RepID=A0A521EVD7_9RHOB|nr:ABC transporter substrate-binding protein [Paracoccus laeviglucosivorans]SMO87070.1 iron complex transport system substrate-binding protein [Paracoccus laeviglucosivorans]